MFIKSDLISFFSTVRKSTYGKAKDIEVDPMSSTSSSRTNRSPPPNLTINHYAHLQQFTFNELRLATRNFRPENFLGEGGFGTVFKGWVSHNGSSPSRPGVGLPVAVKTLNREGLQGHKEWVVCNHVNPNYICSYILNCSHSYIAIFNVVEIKIVDKYD